MFNEEAVFYRVIAPAKTRWSAPFWCGTGALIRVAALRSVGGVSTDSVTEDIHTTIRMYRTGWTRRVPQRGPRPRAGPGRRGAYMLQRNRWALGAMQVLRRENPLFGPGLTVGQRLAFLTTLFGWFDSWRTFAYMVIPLAVVATGAVPIVPRATIFGPLFLTTLGLQFVALRLLARGHYPPILSLLFEVLRMPAVLPATLAGLLPLGEVTFRVTPKGRTTTGRARMPVPSLLSILAAASSLGLAWFAATLFGLTPVRYGCRGPRSAPRSSCRSTWPSSWPPSAGSVEPVRREPSGGHQASDQGPGQHRRHRRSPRGPVADRRPGRDRRLAEDPPSAGELAVDLGRGVVALASHVRRRVASP